MRPLSPADGRSKVASALVGPSIPDVASNFPAAISFDERADGTGARDQDGPMVARSASPNVGVGGNQPREKLVGFGPSAASDSMLDFIGNNDRGVHLEVNEPVFVSDEHGSAAI